MNSQPRVVDVPVGTAMDRDALFQATYDAHFEYVWRLVRRLGGRDRDLEDLVHDVFVVVYRTLDRYDRQRAIKPWLYGIAFRVVSDYRRRASFQREVVMADKEVTDDAGGPLAHVLSLEARRCVARGLETLPEDQRVVFVMHELEQLSIPDISEALNVPINTLYSRLRLARKRFSTRVIQLRLQRGDP